MSETSNKINVVLVQILLSILFSSNIQADKFSCITDDVDQFIEAKKINFIEISTLKSKKWSKNYFRATTDFKNYYISEKYKKKFSANIKVRFDNELECTFPSKIRISGDHRDHLGWGGKDILNTTPPITSLDVKLLAGNINSVVKFKLFIPHTKKGNNEVFSTALLAELGFLAPKTYHVPAVFNGQETTFLFQEKITKEFIESNDLREAPILEGDERFLFHNDLVSFDRFGLARVLNNNWAKKGNTSLSISASALTQLNKTYLQYLSGNHIYKNSQDRLLSSPSRILGKEPMNKDKGFAAIVLAMGAAHALRPHNRSFYYDPIYRNFKPIYYDGNSTVTKLRLNSPLKQFLRYGDKLTEDEILGSSFALESLRKLNKESFNSRLKDLGLNYSEEEVNLVLTKVIANLETVKKTSIPDREVDPGIPYFSNYKDQPENEDIKKLVFSTEKMSLVEICDLLLTSCYFKKVNVKDYSELLGGRYSNNSKNSYIFIGNKQEYRDGINNKILELKRNYDLEDGAQLVVYGSSKAKIDKKEKEIDLIQTNVSDRFLIVGGKLKDWNIKFSGLSDGEINNQQAFDNNLLTGCLTLLDLSVENISIRVDEALCEDGLNLIRVSGNINIVEVENASRDAIDADFSQLTFNSINIKYAGNDCVDLSSGEYNINFADLSNCQDKAISVGEKSKLIINSTSIFKSNIGLAAKDSSSIKVKTVSTESTNTCFSAYNKKQEYWGGKITISKHDCDPKQIIQGKNSLIEFLL